MSMHRGIWLRIRVAKCRQLCVHRVAGQNGSPSTWESTVTVTSAHGIKSYVYGI